MTSQTYPLYVLHGPNLQFLGKRPHEHYGTTTYTELCEMLEVEAQRLGCTVAFEQSNHEGLLIDFLQRSSSKFLGGIINLGGLSHTSISCRDAIELAGLPVVEVHLSHVNQREDFRKKLVTATACIRTITGLGDQGYIHAMRILKETLDHGNPQKKSKEVNLD